MFSTRVSRFVSNLHLPIVSCVHSTTSATTLHHRYSHNESIDTPGRLRLKDKIAVITGGGAGIGRASSILFSKQGATVIVVDRSESAGNHTVNEINNNNGKARFIKCDIGNELEVQSLFAQVDQQYNGCDIIFNNAGIQHLDDDNAELTTNEIWDMTYQINVKGVWYGCRYGLPLLRKRGGGSIINTASFVGVIGAATAQLAYTSSKGAVLAMSKELAVIHARENIRVNALCPGPLRTKLLMDFLNTEEKKQRRLVHVPIGRFGEATELARAALFLASDESSYVTGTEFMVDGGITAAYVTPTGETTNLPPQ